MRRRRSASPSIAIAAAAAALALAAAGCGGGGSGSSSSTSTGGGGASSSGGGGKASPAQVAAGKKVFASAGCGACHTLKDAGTNGHVGPNLDELQPDQGTVASQVKSGGGGMPSFSGRLSQQQIQAVAAYVAAVAGR